MHSLSEFGANVPAFLAKLWKLVDDPETNELISWSEEGTSFCIRDQAQFSRKLLPMYYKHNNMASFIRQLNMYGFHKIVSADAGSLRLDRDEMEFAHQCFLRGHPYLLEHIKRKVGKSQLLTSKQIEEGKDGTSGGVVVKAEFMNKVLSEVKSMRGRQESVENRLSSMKQENEALWRELSLLRQKHIKQQAIVNKLIQFLVTLVQPSQRLKRRYPLMLNSVPHPSGNTNGKVQNLNPDDDPLSVSLHTSQIMSRSPSGTIIHELDADSILPDGELILPENDSETLASNTITLHVPGSELAEVIATTLEPEVMSPNPEVLDCLDSSIIDNPLSNSPSSVPLLEVNSDPVAQAEEALKASSPSPELLLAVPPSELNPAVVVPSLQASKCKPAITTGHQTAAQKMSTRSSSTSGQGVGSSKFTMTRKSAGGKGSIAGNKLESTQFMSVPIKGIKKEAVESQSAAKREMRVLPPRNRKRKQISSMDTMVEAQSNALENVGAPVDLLAEVGLYSPSSSISASSPGTLNHDASSPGTLNHDDTNGSPCGPVSSPCQLVAYPESPVPIIHSPVSSPASHCSLGQHIPISPISGPTITDVTGPLVVQPSTGSSIPEQQSPRSGSDTLSSPYDMTLACTSQGSSSPASTTALKSSSIFNRDDFDHHVGTMDSELGQLKDFLNSSGIQLDANTLLGLFNGDDLSAIQEDGGNMASKTDATGNELMYYQPDFMDLEDIWNNDNGRATPPPSPVISSEVNTPVMMPASPGFFGTSAKRRRN